MKPYWKQDNNIIYQGHVLEVLKSMAAESVQMCVTSPPYWGLRDYGLEPQIWDGDENCRHEWGNVLPSRGQSGWHTFEKKYHSPGSHKTTIGSKIKDTHLDQNEGSGQFCQLCNAWRGSLGLEPTPELFIQHIVQIFREVRKILRSDGTVWLNLGDSYAANIASKKPINNHAVAPNAWDGTQETPVKHPYKQKDLVGIPWMVALALRKDGWYLRSDIIWSKPNPMPESVTDRPTKAHEYLFLLAKGSWVTRIVKLSDLSDERLHFGHNLRFESSYSLPCMLGIGIATSIFNFSQFDHNYSLPPFYSEIWEKCFNEGDSLAVCGSKKMDRITAIAVRFLSSKTTLKEFFQEIDSFRSSLPNGNNFLESRILSKFSLSPSINCNRNTSISINDSGQICEYDFIHKCINIKKPSRCQYYYDADAIREPHQPDGRKVTTTTIGQGAHENHHGSAGHERWPNSGRNKRTIWTIATQPMPEAHFATFPEKLIEPCILAGTSEKGCCVECSAPWERVVETRGLEVNAKNSGDRKELHGPTYSRHKSSIPGGQSLVSQESKTVGWKPGCKCYNTGPFPEYPKQGKDEPDEIYENRIEPVRTERLRLVELWKPLPVVPCVVCDIFLGSGTSFVVSNKHKRNFIGIELSESYLKDIAVPRIEKATRQKKLIFI